MSQPIEKFDAVIIGSGFGGAVTAHRLSEAGLRVCILERGRAYPAGSFPRTPNELSQSFWDPSQGLYGLFHIHFSKYLAMVMSSGLGGGSLVYAGVMARPKDQVLDSMTRATYGAFDFRSLDANFERVQKTIRARPVPFGQPGYENVERMRAFRDAAPKLRERHQVEWSAPPLAIEFSDSSPLRKRFGMPQDNLHGVERNTCKLCAECIFGCNEGSKNSLDYNYLSMAKRNGAEIRTLAEVRVVQPHLKGGYLAGYLDHSDRDPSSPPKMTYVHGNRLIISAGSMNSVYLLMRNRGHFPKISHRLGEGFSGNGDLLALAVMGKKSLRPDVGPVITSMINNDTYSIQDVGVPAFLMWFMAGLDSMSFSKRVSEAILRRSFWTRKTNYAREISKALNPGEFTDRTIPICSMGHETPKGRLYLDEKNRLELNWTRKDSAEYYSKLRAAMTDLAKVWGAQKVDLIHAWKDKLSSVHPIGGAPIAPNADLGVVGGDAQVHGYPGLYIIDGSLLAGTVGINPSLMISAIADQVSEEMVRKGKAV